MRMHANWLLSQAHQTAELKSVLVQEIERLDSTLGESQSQKDSLRRDSDAGAETVSASVRNAADLTV
jgi:hypothetical protein